MTMMRLCEGKVRWFTRSALAVILAFFAGCACADVFIDDFEVSGMWSYHPDGGVRVAMQLERERVKSGTWALGVRYRDAKPHWGNIFRHISVPQNACAVAFWLYVEHAEQRAKMFVWFFEPDGDGYIQQVRVNRTPVGELTRGWHRVILPLAKFGFVPRGNRKRSFLTVNKMLIGFNFGDMDVVIDDLRFLTAERSIKIPLPRVGNPQLEGTAMGRIAILYEPNMPIEGIASNANVIARVLQEAGYGVTLLRAGDIADAKTLNSGNFDALIIPCGATFPYDGRDALLVFLKSGGVMLTMGGYAFDNLVVFTEGGWQRVDFTVTAAEMDTPHETRTINTRFGNPGDSLRLRGEQIGIFDPSYELLHVHEVMAADGQHIIPRKWRIEDGVGGFAAVALIGSNNPVFGKVHARWIPLIVARDRYGRMRGAVGALLYHYAGTFARSAWMFFGATNRDLFAEGDENSLLPLLPQLLEALLRRTFLHELASEFECYRDGEPVNITVHASNFGKKAQHVKVIIAITAPQRIQLCESEFDLASGATETVTATWHPEKFTGDLYHFAATLSVRDGDGWSVVDEMRNAFVVWRDDVVRRGLHLTLRENYLHDGKRARFIFGTNQTGIMWFSASENPLTWLRDFRSMRDNGVRMLRILHFSPYSKGGYDGRPTNRALDLVNRPKKLRRATDAIVQLAQRFGIVIFLSAHDWMPVELTDEELKAQRDWNEFWARRYSHVAGIIYDIQNEPHVGLPAHPHVLELWREYLRKRYGDDDTIRRAWRITTQNLPLDLKPLTNAWDDVKAYDLNRFKVELLNRWVRVNAEGLHAGDPDALVTVGYLPSMPPADKVFGNRFTSFSNMHYYGNLYRLPAQFKITDRRFEGKSLSLGEFGAQEAHDARTHGKTGEFADASIRRFLTTGHYALGLGASFAANWDWKDMPECVFPWGINHQDLVRKLVLKAYRNMSMFFQTFEPRYVTPEVFLVLPDAHRLGANWTQVNNALFYAIDLLISCHVNFGVINEFDIGKLPKGVRALLCPVPYCMTDEAFAKLAEFVRGGGALYISGDIAFDELRQPRRVNRWNMLGLQPFPPHTPADVPPGIWREHARIGCIGDGMVFHAPYPLEMNPSERDRDVYLEFLRHAQVRRIAIEPDMPHVHAFMLPTADGGFVLVLINAGDEAQPIVIREGDLNLQMTLQPFTPALAYAARGKLRALEAHGDVRRGRETLVRASGHFMLIALDGDDIANSSMLLFAPTDGGEFAICSARQWETPTCELLDFIDGECRVLTRRRLTGTREFRFTIPDDERCDLFLVAERHAFTEARSSAADLVYW